MRYRRMRWVSALVVLSIATYQAPGQSRDHEQIKAASMLSHVTPAVVESDLLDAVINDHPDQEALRALRHQHAGQWTPPNGATARTWSFDQWKSALQCDQRFTQAVSTQQLDLSGRVAYATDVTCCERSAMWIERLFPARPILRAARTALAAVPDDPDEFAMAAQLARDELEAIDAIIKGHSANNRRVAPDAFINTWRAARLTRLIWEKQRAATSDSAVQLVNASDGLSVLIPVAAWIRETAPTNDALAGLCSGMEHEVAQLWFRYQQVLAIALRRDQEDQADNAELFTTWRLLVATEQDSIALVLAAAEDADLTAPAHIRLIARGVISGYLP